jgi:hypothetical protein
MNITRQYFDTLLEYFKQICSLQNNQTLQFMLCRQELSNLINRIIKFNLFQLTFSESFFSVLNKETIDNFSVEKILIINELHYELYECLWTTRLRFGGELISYISKIQIALLQLNIYELKEFESEKKIPEHYYFPQQFLFADEAEKKNKLKDITSFNKKSLIIKPKVKISEKDYTLIEEQLVREISIYKDYILNNYSDNLDIFPFYRKKVIAYLTQGISKEVFEFRIHSYVTTDDDYSITLKHHFYDFYPSYAYNLEEITNDLFSWVVLAFDRRRLSYSNPFTVKNIHRELVSRYINNANENQITEFVKFLLKFKRFNFRSKLERAEYDLAAHLDSDYYIFEIFYRQSKSLDNMTKKISLLTKLSNESKICFIFIVYPGREVASLLKQKNILFYNIFDLCDEFFKVDNSIVLHWYIKPLLFTLQIQDNLIQKLGESLINRLINCPEGEKNWSDYEKIGVDTFKFLFQDNFKKFLRSHINLGGGKN